MIELASRLLLLSHWSRRTGLAVVIANGPAAKRSSLRACGLGRIVLDEGKSWMPDEDSNLD